MVDHRPLNEKESQEDCESAHERNRKVPNLPTSGLLATVLALLEGLGLISLPKLPSV
jgi:hypothetical protein